jgi:transcriptional regulator with PAS, ATPase and Fis domain
MNLEDLYKSKLMSADDAVKHTWPGNVRELENVIERGMILADVEGISVLMPRHLSFLPPHPQLLSDEDLEEEPGEIRDLKTMVNEFEKKVLQQVLRDTQGDKVLAAKYLNINLSSLYRKAKKYEIDL